MKYNQIHTILLVGSMLLSFAACTKGGSMVPPNPDQPPGDVSLTLPENNTACEIGKVSGNLAEVSFSWESASNTVFYDLIITNTGTNQSITSSNLTTTATTLALTRGYSYRWRVTAANSGNATSDSETWRFYLAADGDENAAPFAPEAIAPELGAAVNASASNTVTLQWEAVDPDADALTFTLRIDTVDGKQEPTPENTGLSESTKAVTVESGEVYYWSIIASDGSSAVYSDIFSFRVNE